VKVRGFRIELGEIEAALLDHTSVREAVVIPAQDDTRGTILMAHVQLHPKTDVTTADLRPYLRAKLPEYMIPAAIVIHQRAFKLTANGKVDRHALLESSSLAEAPARLNSAPTDEVQRMIAAAWQQTLGLSSVSIDDNFFDVGGDSVTIVQVYNSLKKKIDTDFTVVDLFQYPTIRAFSEHLKESKGGDQAPASDVQDRVQQRISSGVRRSARRKQVQ
jgi:aryl carrier-like protein